MERQYPFQTLSNLVGKKQSYRSKLGQHTNDVDFIRYQQRSQELPDFSFIKKAI